jgi:hypothetical protein
LNNPLAFFDPNGKETRALVGGYTEMNPAGHIALEINGTVYSAGSSYVNKGLGGDWGVGVDAYLAPQEGIRETRILTLGISPEQEAKLESTLQARNPGDSVGLIEGSCVDVTMNALNTSGIFPAESGGELARPEGQLLDYSGPPTAITPMGAAGEIARAGLVSNRRVTGSQPKVSWWTSLKNGIKELIAGAGE